jgi:hypothetical protein
MIQQAVTVLVPEHPAAVGENPAEPGAGGDEASATARCRLANGRWPRSPGHG